MLVGDEEVRLVDFGLAVDLTSARRGPQPRGGLVAFYPPEAARAVLERRTPPPPTTASEIAVIGALLYRILTGEGTSRRRSWRVS